MKERPILFTGPMVRAILDGRKTQTRRVVKPQPVPFGEDSPFTQATLKEHVGKLWMPVGGVFQDAWKKPFGTVGDRLWVRETWQAWRMCSLEYNEWDICDCAPSEIYGTYGKPKVEYAATSDSVGPWRPSIHMPRWASRITLEITAVRVERVQDITEEDAIKEGVVESECGRNASRALFTYKRQCVAPPVLQFADLWQSIYANWDANPWVWVYEFRRIKP